ncbi:MAG: hypothetical protein C4536_01425 [Actinobacteria bacterium]|jgi:hypothetical protein|nr:MAG: hypothetical protein C4536_01425 [Actinomycetota bacterium]
MRQFTVRGLPEEIERRIVKEAKEKGISLNKAIVSLIEKEAGGKGKKAGAHHDLDHLFGIWREVEGREFDGNLGLQREVDQDLWKRSD